MSKLTPLNDKIVVQILEQENKTQGGLIIPDTAKEKPQQGKVLGVGAGKVLDSGARSPIPLQVGDVVVFAKFGGTEIKLDNQDYVILSESNVLAVLDK